MPVWTPIYFSQKYLGIQDPVLVSYYILTDVCKRGDLLVRGSLIYNGYQVRLMG